MDSLQEYLDGEYKKEKEQYNSVEELIKKVLPIYFNFDDKRGWNYQIKKEDESKNISTSTVSMMAFSMSVLFGEKFDLFLGDIKVKNKNYFEMVYQDRDKCIYNLIYNKAIVLILEQFSKNGNHFESDTYGEDDPFTLTWIKHIIDNKKENELIDCNQNIDLIKKICKDKTEYVFKQIYSDINNLSYSSPTSKNNPIEPTHTFPLLKVVQLYYSFKDDSDCKIEIKPEYLNAVKTTLKNKLHYYLSLSDIDNSNFDAAEMVFSLEGLLLLDDNRENFDQALLNRVFDVINKRQNISIYWRPLTPFVYNKKGFALLPLSVEIAMSLIRICRLLGKRGEDLFSNNINIFNKYTKWIKTRISISQSDDQNYYGWCSEHVYKPNIIHLWETSQVLVYLVNYNDMLQKHIANKSFNYANLSIKYFIEEYKNWGVDEPVKGLDVYNEINKEYIQGNQVSMLLYGPPGTGKTTIAENVAKSKKWPLVTITPSDFITNGADKVETKAKNIFTVLCEQKNMVILFDEIDRLILDRDSKLYYDQSDIFQFMTPSMLVKINDLHKNKNIIFIICTNYAERIDPAIKRLGRIDNPYLVLPPDKNRRMGIINEYVDEYKTNDNWRDILDNANKDWLKIITKNTALYTYTEIRKAIKYIVETIKKKKVEDLDNIIKKLDKPTISLTSYANKLGITNGQNDKNKKDDDIVQKPTKDFLYLVYLKIWYDEKNIDISNFNQSEKLVVYRFLYEKFEKYNDDFLNYLNSQLKCPTILKTFAIACGKIIQEIEKDNASNIKIQEALKKLE